MIPTVIHIQSKDRKDFLSFFRFADSLERALSKEYQISFPASANAVVGREAAFSFPKRKNIYKYLKKLRETPGNTEFEPWFGQSLSAGFAGCVLSPAEPFLISAESRDLALMANIPWELALRPGAQTPGTGNQPTGQEAKGKPEDTFSNLSFGRQINEYKSTVTINARDRLRVLCCISDPDPGYSIGGSGFAADMAELQEKYRWLLHIKMVLSNERVDTDPYRPDFGQLIIEIENFHPHLFILAAHGRSNGKEPSVYFFNKNRQNRSQAYSWEPMESIAKALQKSRNCVAAMLVACDLSFSSDGYASSSGAITLLSKGIPAVIAMQSKILARAGKTFLENLLAHFAVGYHDGNPENHLIHAVSFGRQAIARSLDSYHALDWSFPGLFFTNDGYHQLEEIQMLIPTFRQWLFRLEHSLPSSIVNDRFDRPGLQQTLRGLINERHGLVIVTGEPGCGKSTLLQWIALQIYREATEKPTGRPLLYLDFGMEDDAYSDVLSFFNAINGKVKTIAPADPMSGTRGDGLFSPIALPAGEMLLQKIAAGAPTLLLEWADAEERVVIIDNLSGLQLNNLRDTLGGLERLLHSLVVVVIRTGDTVPGQVADNLAIPVLATDELKEYTRQFCKRSLSEQELEEAVGQLRAFSSGNLFVLRSFPIEEILRGSVAGPGDRYQILLTRSGALLRSLQEEGRKMYEAILRMIHIPHGISADMCPAVGLDEAVFQQLITANRLILRPMLQPSAVGGAASTDVYQVPGYLRETVKQLAAEDLTEQATGFLASVGAYFGEIAEDADAIRRMTTIQNRIELMRDLIELIPGHPDYAEVPEMLLLLAEREMYELDQTSVLLEWWNKVLASMPEDNRKAASYLRAAKAAQQLGQVTQADEYLVIAKRLLERDARAGDDSAEENYVDFYTLRGAVLKDQGDFGKTDEITRCYEEALDRVIALLASVGGGEDQKEWVEKKALIYYNRAIFRRWWLRENEKAVEDMQKARELARKVYEHLFYRAISEEVDMQIDLKQDIAALNALEVEISPAMTYFEDKGGLGRLAWCHYRIAKIEKRMYNLDPVDNAGHLYRALKYYEYSRDVARRGQIRLIEWAAEAHVLAILMEGKLQQRTDLPLAKLTDSDIFGKIDKTSGALGHLDSVWASRLLRDLAIEQAVYRSQRRPVDSEVVMSAFNYALNTCQGRHLSPMVAGTDRRRLAYCLVTYGTWLRENQLVVEQDRFLHRMADMGFAQESDAAAIAQKPNFHG
ncbi:MAG TPA: hypothetical protein VHE34_16765 [Puia sp.]|uniref:hypothetical protein n=1 Tax=Puia sp. TaxID=2045100 RepID=UPI002CE50273|nr:hypothetical protein [Puia sp.]HVU96885.1 hypothetical protein [Puia sp.]